MKKQMVTPFSGLSKIRMRGVLSIHVRDARTGRILRSIHKKNTITNQAGDVLRALIAQRTTDPAASRYAIGSMRFGTSSVVATQADTDLLAEVSTIRKELDDTAKTNGVSGEIVFQATLETTDGNGSTLREVGLFTTGVSWVGDVDPATADVFLFARQVHAAVEKTSALTLEYNWAIQFTV